MDVEKGKAIFYKYNGSIVSIEREVGDEYAKCKIPSDVEAIWRKDIMERLLEKIGNSHGADKFSHICGYAQLLSDEQAVDFLLHIINNDNLDTFTCLLLCESLKRYLGSTLVEEVRKEKILSVLAVYRDKMMREKIIVDSSYMNKSYMKDYDFSEENIKLRIRRL